MDHESRKTICTMSKGGNEFAKNCCSSSRHILMRACSICTPAVEPHYGHPGTDPALAAIMNGEYRGCCYGWKGTPAVASEKDNLHLHSRHDSCYSISLQYRALAYQRYQQKSWASSGI